MRNAYRILPRKSDWKTPLGRFKYRLEDNIKTELKEMGCKGVDWIQLAQDRILCQILVTMISNFSITKIENIMASSATVSLSRRNLHYGLSQSQSRMDLLKPLKLCVVYTAFTNKVPVN
jgi:hypothetical protein